MFAIECGGQVQLSAMQLASEGIDGYHALLCPQADFDVGDDVRFEHSLFYGQPGAGVDKPDCVQRQGFVTAGSSGLCGVRRSSFRSCQRQQRGAELVELEYRVNLWAFKTGVAHLALGLGLAEMQRQLQVGDLAIDIDFPAGLQIHRLRHNAIDLYLQVIQLHDLLLLADAQLTLEQNRDNLLTGYA